MDDAVECRRAVYGSWRRYRCLWWGGMYIPLFAVCHMILTSALHPTICRRPPSPVGRIVLPKMRIRFGTILSPPLMWQWNVLTIYHRRINNRSEEDENMVWTDSQDYGSDEILSHPFVLTQPVQRAACALHFAGSVPSRIHSS